MEREVHLPKPGKTVAPSLLEARLLIDLHRKHVPAIRAAATGH